MTSTPGLPVLDPAAVDAYGELVFGRRLRLHVLLWVAERDDVFNQSQAAAGVGYSSSGEVGKELERLVALDMVRKYGRPGRVGPQNYARITEHPGWLIAEAARTAIAALTVDGTAAVDRHPVAGHRRRDSDDGDPHVDPHVGDGHNRVPSIRARRDAPS